ncbi:uncharacterized protein [Narcine bancroftii]|uniref:uncharacterized protein isoform X2 n=1 Tax=Narcine bancroftii TaxID=1343680 RepID=UPI0038314087
MIRPPAPCSSAKGGSETLAFSRGPGEGETPPQDGRRGDPALQCERWVETSPWGGREDHAAPRGSGEGGDEGKTGHSADLSHLYPPGPRGDFYPSITLCPPAKDSLDVYFALRPGVLKSVIEEMRKHLSSEDGPIKGYWLLVEIDQWNCEGERLILLTSCSLLLGHYDFVGLRCNLVRRIPLRMIDRITHGPFQFSTFSLSSSPPSTRSSLTAFVKCTGPNPCPARRTAHCSSRDPSTCPQFLGLSLPSPAGPSLASPNPGASLGSRRGPGPTLMVSVHVGPAIPFPLGRGRILPYWPGIMSNCALR